jgi:hypothetical protein
MHHRCAMQNVGTSDSLKALSQMNRLSSKRVQVRQLPLLDSTEQIWRILMWHAARISYHAARMRWVPVPVLVQVRLRLW